MSHYIRLDNQNRIIYGFSDAFEQPEAGDICILDDPMINQRQFVLNGEYNPTLFTADGYPRFIYTNNTITNYTPTLDETLSKLKTTKKTQINNECGLRIDGGFFSYAEKSKDSNGTYQKLLYKSDSNHREQLSMLYNLAYLHTQNLFTDTPCRWKDASKEDEECHPITDTAAMQLYQESGLHLMWCKTTSDSLINSIIAAQSVDEINAIVWPNEPDPIMPTA